MPEITRTQKWTLHKEELPLQLAPQDVASTLACRNLPLAGSVLLGSYVPGAG